jgi:putative ABC transport system permease protein
MLTEGLWRSQFGSDPSIVGRTIDLDATPYTVVGVLPAALRLPLDYANRTFTQIWVPARARRPTDPQERGNHGLNALGRLTPGVVAVAGAGRDRHPHPRVPAAVTTNNYDTAFG